ncbi:hypothetical protein G6F43_002075 [Rhizopus delemar]|nr:hypothetical protein G6F43_002075 [Rhizopus delemar]
MTTIEDLPKEIILKIFDLLETENVYQCQLVNKHFHSASIPALWRNLSIDTEDDYHWFINYSCVSGQGTGQYVKSIYFCFGSNIDDEKLMSVLPLIPNLEELEIKDATILTDKSLSFIPKCCKKLNKLTWESLTMTYEAGLMLGQCSELETLHLNCCYLFHPNCLQPLIDVPLKRLVITEGSWLIETARDLARFHHLKELTIQNCGDIPNEFFQQLAFGLPNLKHLYVEKVKEEAGLVSFLKTHSGLREIWLDSCHVTDATVETITHYIHGLELLLFKTTEDVSIQALHQLVCHCPNLSMCAFKRRRHREYLIPDPHRRPDTISSVPDQLVSSSSSFYWDKKMLHYIRTYYSIMEKYQSLKEQLEASGQSGPLKLLDELKKQIEDFVKGE